ncbi:hypothetical protein BDF21DRAFT_449302 [Thamnidium elegans]|nr:hypothetical protein BDF21DRAFT_449302 [Thamnidium elegans]
MVSQGKRDRLGGNLNDGFYFKYEKSSTATNYEEDSDSSGNDLSAYSEPRVYPKKRKPMLQYFILNYFGNNTEAQTVCIPYNITYFYGIYNTCIVRFDGYAVDFIFNKKNILDHEVTLNDFNYDEAEKSYRLYLLILGVCLKKRKENVRKGSKTKSVEPFLEILYKTDKLRCIEEIKVDDNLSMQSREIHVLTAYKYRDTMTYLHLNYFRYTTDGNYLVFLPQFKHLTFLSISNDLLNGDRYMLIPSALGVCPKLVGFGLQTKRHFPDASKAGLLKMMEQYDGTNDRNLKLKRLYFELHDFHEAYMKYVIYYTRLDLFCLNMIDANIYEWLSDKEVRFIYLQSIYPPSKI